MVLTLAFVAILMPINPAKPDINAPTTNESATKALEFASELPLITRRIATATTKTASTLYSAFKKAIAPSAMFLAMLAIF